LFYKHFFMLDFLGARLFCMCCVETQGHVIGSIVKAKNNKSFESSGVGKASLVNAYSSIERNLRPSSIKSISLPS
jgi:putative ribosome biogenesis GTPase RsgA